MKIGLKVTFKDPENPAGVINAQFATARSHPEMLELLRDIAKKDVAESVAMQKLDNATERLKRSDDPEAMQEELLALRNASDDATLAVVEASRLFVVTGFKLAGASDEQAEKLAGIVDMADLALLKAKCLYGAGSLDFTKEDGRL